MAAITVAGMGAMGATLCLPRVGCWHMDAVLDTAEQLSGSVKVSLGALELTGFVLAGGPYTETGYYRIVGGGGGLGGSKLATARAYGRCQLRVPLQALLKDVGEELDPTSDQAVQNTQLAAWSLLGVSSGRQLAALLQAAPAGTAWRMKPGGKVWVGAETWPDAGIDFEEIGQLPHEGKIEITTEEPTLLPGTKLDGHKVGYVEHRIDSGRLRTLALIEAA